MRRGFTLLELLTVIGIMVVLGFLLLPSLRGRRSGNELDLATRQIVALLREAQGRAISESLSTSWGVHLDNVATSTAFYSMFSGTYNSSTAMSRTLLPKRVRFATSTVATGTSTEIIFTQATGRPVASTTIRLELTESTTNVSSTMIIVNSFGAITF